jgi:hypothetical protein
MGKELALPDWLKAKIDQGEVSADADKVVSAVESVPRISLKSRRFNFVENGEVVMKTADPIHVVIVGVQPEHGMAKTFYEGAYEPGDSSPPDCSSFDGVRPDSWITSPQSETCASCPQNKWGSAKSMSGGKAKACRDSKRLMVVNAKNIEKGTVFTLNVTVASLKNLSNYGKDLAKKGIPLEAVITTISIDEDADWAMLHFDAAGVLNEAQGTVAIQRAASKEWEDGMQLEHHSESVGALPSPQPEASAPKSEASAVAEKKETAAPPAEDENIDDLLSSW